MRSNVIFISKLRNKRGDDKMFATEIVVLSLGLSLDVFAYALYKGAVVPDIKKSDLIKMTVIFVVLQSISLIVGNVITNMGVLRHMTEGSVSLCRKISILIFMGIGGYMICKSVKLPVVEEKRETVFHIRQILVWACITSLDTFLAGIGYGFFKTDLLITALVVSITTAICVITGVLWGYHLGGESKNKIISLGGTILLIGGIELMVRHFI